MCVCERHRWKRLLSMCVLCVCVHCPLFFSEETLEAATRQENIRNVNVKQIIKYEEQQNEAARQNASLAQQEAGGGGTFGLGGSLVGPPSSLRSILALASGLITPSPDRPADPSTAISPHLLRACLSNFA